MMNNSESQRLESYVPVYDVAPEKWEEGRPFLVEQLRKYGNALNTREIGFYLDEELLSGKSFIPGVNNATDGGSSQQFRSILRKVIDFGALPNNTTKSVAHGITFDANFSLIDLWLSATDPVNFKAFALMYWDDTGSSPITLNMDATKINVTTTGNYKIYTRCFCILEYIQEL
jgi:hypothetical protein